MEQLLQSFQAEWSSFLSWLPKLLLALGVLIFFWVLARVAARGARMFLRQTQLAPTHQLFFGRLTIWIVTAIGLMFAADILGLGFLAAGLLASGGLTAVVLGFAFREIGENFLAGFFLAVKCPFRLGDLIQSGDLQGVVRGIELRSTHVRTADGRDIFIPNADIFNRPLVNFTLDGLRRLSFTVGIDYGDEPDAACRLLQPEVQQIAGVLRDPPSQVVISALLPAYIELEVFFWVNTFDQTSDPTEVRARVISCCRTHLRSAQFSLSNDATTNLALFSGSPLALELQPAPDKRG